MAFCFQSKADCFIAKENHVILQQEGNCPKEYKQLIISGVDESLELTTETKLKNIIQIDSPFILTNLNYINDYQQKYNFSPWATNDSIISMLLESNSLYFCFSYGNIINIDCNSAEHLYFTPILKTSPQSQPPLFSKLSNAASCASSYVVRPKIILKMEEFYEGSKLYGKEITSLVKPGNSNQAGWYFGRLVKGNRQIDFVNYIKDEKEFNSTPAKRAKESAKEYLRQLISEEYNYNELLKKVPNIFVKPIKEAIDKAFSKTEINNMKFKKLFGGLSESNLFLIHTHDKKFVLRLLDPQKKIEIRKSELNAHNIASNLNIAPSLVATDLLSLVIIMDFVDGRTMKSKDLNNPLLIKKIMHTLQKFHNYQGDDYLHTETKMDAIKELYENYNKKNAVYPSGYEKIYINLQQVYSNLKRNRVPTHGDLNPANIIITHEGNIYFIDWAEARIDNPLLDIGWLSACSGADILNTENLLHLYLGREPTKNEFQEVLYFKNVTNFLVATILIGEQTEYEQKKLDFLLSMPIKKSSEHKSEDITSQEITSLKGHKFILYALSWLKEFIDIQTYIENIYEN